MIKVWVTPSFVAISAIFVGLSQILYCWLSSLYKCSVYIPSVTRHVTTTNKKWSTHLCELIENYLSRFKLSLSSLAHNLLSLQFVDPPLVYRSGLYCSVDLFRVCHVECHMRVSFLKLRMNVWTRWVLFWNGGNSREKREFFRWRFFLQCGQSRVRLQCKRFFFSHKQTKANCREQKLTKVEVEKYGYILIVMLDAAAVAIVCPKGYQPV